LLSVDEVGVFGDEELLAESHRARVIGVYLIGHMLEPARCHLAEQLHLAGTKVFLVEATVLDLLGFWS
jgi:hypothetical protein